jgi:hypothetical protein
MAHSSPACHHPSPVRSVANLMPYPPTHMEFQAGVRTHRRAGGAGCQSGGMTGPHFSVRYRFSGVGHCSYFCCSCSRPLLPESVNIPL